MSQKEQIDFSIVIPARNEEQFIEKCLESLMSQDYRGSFEVIVIDGESEDATRSIVLKYSQCDSRLRLLSNPQRITPAAFNYGVLAARGRYILTVGAHWHLPEDYLRRIDDAFQRYPHVDCVGGRIIRVTKGETGTAIEAARSSPMGGGLSLRNTLMEERIINQANIAYIWRREVFNRIGLFDERFVKNQDNEFNLRTLAAGLLTLYSPDIVFYYNAPDSYKKLFRQVCGYSSYIPMIQIKHRALIYPKIAVLFIVFLSWIGFLIAGMMNAIDIKVPLSMFGIYVGAVLVGCMRYKSQRSVAHLIRMVVACLTVHLGICLGYLRGLFWLLRLPMTVGLWKDYNRIDRKKGSSL